MWEKSETSADMLAADRLGKTTATKDQPPCRNALTRAWDHR